MKFVLLLSAALLCGTSAYFSVIGLSKIFVGVFLPFIILEFSKFVAALYLHSQWKYVNKIIKAYMVTAVVVLMVMTSSGIYGYLSAAAMTHTTSSKGESANVSLVDNQIKSLESRKLELTNDRIRLDGFVDKAETGVNLYNRQRQQRKVIDEELKGISSQLWELQKKKTELGSKYLSVQQEVGPALYLAKSIYGNDSMDAIEGAIRIVIYLIVFTFDPLAVVLLIAAQNLFEKKKEESVEPEPVQEPIETNAVEPIEQTIDDVTIPPSSLTYSEEVSQGINERQQRIIDAAASKLQRRVDNLTRR